MTVSFAVIGFVYGYKEERFSYAVIALAAGFLISCLCVLPPWPCYRKNPLPWQKPVEENTAEEESTVSGDSDELTVQESPIVTRSTRRRKN